MTCLGLAVFDVLCVAAGEVEALREHCRPGSDAWTALTEVVQAVDAVIDRLVESSGFDDE